jgi:hypothetical protein
VENEVPGSRRRQAIAGRPFIDTMHLLSRGTSQKQLAARSGGAALEMIGLAGGPVRGPGDELMEEEKQMLRQILADIGLLAQG